ncbi:YodC family protein [Paraburkholderia sp.]|uniref:YodC family protein n=1 Tax=Paraburkholderia sp. TaxID=1926495 RepID=UPI002393AFEF|nr:YodC family protein [Paraburkholderia sp.]MDE1181633.1 YodC family protein [Paraburkholderia sp.]
MLIATIDAFDTQENASFRIGDVVTLKTGGARMTVTYAGPVALADGDWLVCQWFDETGEFRQEMFEQHRVRAEPRSIPPGSVRLRSLTRAVHPE